MKTVIKWAKDMAQKRPITVVASVVLAAFGSAAIIRNIDTWTLHLTNFVITNVTDATNASVVHPRVWFVWMPFVLMLCLLVLGTLLIQSDSKRRVAVRQQTDRQTKAFKTLQGMMRAASHIRDRTFPLATGPLKTFHSIKIVYKIHKDFTAELHREYDISASDQPVHFWTTGNRATAYATPVEYLDDINFNVHGNNEGEIVYLPVENDPLSKQIVIYFLPRIEPGQTRKVVITYTWPGLLRQLDQLGEERFNFTYESKETIEHIEIHFYLESGTGKKLFCEISGPPHANTRLVENKHPELNWSGFIYTVEKSAAGTTHYELTVRLRPA